MMNEEKLKQTVRDIPDFPSEGILFRDITTLVKDPEAYGSLIATLANELRPYNIDIVIGPEARGFVVGSAVAYALRAGFVLARKPGKLPCEVKRLEYGLEYGSDCLEIHTDAIKPGARVALVDDLLATGGTALATRIPGFIASLWISRTSCPYSRPYEMEYTSAGSFPGLRASTKPALIP